MICCCTSFSEEGYEVYGRRFIESYLANCDKPLAVFYEGRKPDIRDDQIRYVKLDADADLDAFLKAYDVPMAHGIVGKKDGKWVADYRFQAIKFAKKVFALTTFAENVDWWVWIDADVVFEKPLDGAFWSTVCPPDKLMSYLGRKDWGHSECGFVAYRVGTPQIRSFLKRFRRAYTSGDVFSLPEWHDSYVFDVIRSQYPHVSDTFKNLAEGVPGTDVWPHTVLGEYMRHMKGPESKMKEYGNAV